jgi:hypothetical protein
MEFGSIIIPRPAGPDKPYRSPDEHWEEVTRDIYGSAELPRTIRFEHDPKWERRFWSIQNARNQYELTSFGFWSFIGALMILANLSWYFAPFLRHFRWR